MDGVAICWKPHDLLLPPYMPRTCCNTEKTDFKQQHCLYLPACLLDLYPILHGSLFQLSLPFLFGFCAVNLVSRQACYLLPICPAWRFTECPAEFSFSDHAAVHQHCSTFRTAPEKTNPPDSGGKASPPPGRLSDISASESQKAGLGANGSLTIHAVHVNYAVILQH